MSTTTLYCDGDTHSSVFELDTNAPGRQAILTFDPAGQLSNGHYSSDAHLLDVRIFDTDGGPWAQTDGSGVCPNCQAAHPEMYRESTEADLAALGRH